MREVELSIAGITTGADVVEEVEFELWSVDELLVVDEAIKVLRPAEDE